MNKADLIDFVAENADTTKKNAKQIIESVLEGITTGLVTDAKVGLVGFGTFTAVKKAARTARNPKTGETIDVPAKVVPKFKASAILKEAVAGLEL